MRHPQLDGQVISGETSWNKPPRLTQHSVCFGPEHLLFIRLLRTVCFFGILSHPAWNQHVETRQSWTFRSNIFHDPPVIVSSYHSALISMAAAGKDGDADVWRGTQVKSIFVLPGLDISNGHGNMKSRTPLSDYNSDFETQQPLFCNNYIVWRQQRQIHHVWLCCIQVQTFSGLLRVLKFYLQPIWNQTLSIRWMII